MSLALSRVSFWLPGMRCLLGVSALGILACGPAIDLKQPADACARVAQIFRGLPAPVTLTSQEPEAAGLTVSITYRGMNDFNAPVEGEARCVFRRDKQGGLSLVEASVDGQQLPAQDRASLN